MARYSFARSKVSPGVRKTKGGSTSGLDSPGGERLQRNLKDVKKNRILLQRYGLSLDQFEKMLLIQRGKCGICERFFHGVRRMYVDHDHHGHQRVRGILCYTCNKRVLGRGLEDPWLHEQAAKYLRSTFDGRNLGKGEIQ